MPKDQVFINSNSSHERLRPGSFKTSITSSKIFEIKGSKQIEKINLQIERLSVKKSSYLARKSQQQGLKQSLPSSFGR